MPPKYVQMLTCFHDNNKCMYISPLKRVRFIGEKLLDVLCRKAWGWGGVGRVRFTNRNPQYTGDSSAVALIQPWTDVVFYSGNCLGLWSVILRYSACLQTMGTCVRFFTLRETSKKHCRYTFTPDVNLEPMSTNGTSIWRFDTVDRLASIR